MSADKITVAEQIRLREAGFSIQFVAERAGRSKSTMARRLKLWGVEPLEPVAYSRRPRGRKLDGREDEVRRLHWEENLSTRQIADRLGVSNYTVSMFMNARGIPIRSHAEATRLMYQVNPPARRRVSTTWNSETAGAASRAYWRERRKRERANAARRERRRQQRQPQEAA